MKPTELSSILRWAYCLDLDVFLEVMGWVQDYYTTEKWQIMQQNFTKFFTDLDLDNQAKFVKGWEDAHRDK